MVFASQEAKRSHPVVSGYPDDALLSRITDALAVVSLEKTIRGIESEILRAEDVCSSIDPYNNGKRIFIYA